MTEKIISVKPDDTLESVLAKFIKYRISGMPVLKSGKMVGLVTEEDVIEAIDAYSLKIHYDTHEAYALVMAVLEHVKYGKEFDVIMRKIVGSGKLKVHDFMQRKVMIIGPDERIEEAARMMVKHKIKRLPVVRNGRLVGIIARADIIKALGNK